MSGAGQCLRLFLLLVVFVERRGLHGFEPSHGILGGGGHGEVFDFRLFDGVFDDGVGGGEIGFADKVQLLRRFAQLENGFDGFDVTVFG